MRAYINKTWWAYLLLLLFCIVIPLVLANLEVTVLSSSIMTIWYFIAMPVLCSVVITITSSKINDYDWAALVVIWLLPLLLNFMLSGFKIVLDPCMPIHYELIILSIPVLETFFLSGIASIIVLHKQRKAKRA